MVKKEPLKRGVLARTSPCVRAKVVFNAAGIFTDEVRQMDDAATPPLLTVSRGSHLVFGPEVLGGSAGIMVPKTRDGRVIFAIPWQGRVVVGTTDMAAPSPTMEPGHTDEEVEFLLGTVNPYLAKKVTRDDILAVFSGLRPLVTRKSASTAKLSREHFLDVSAGGMITIAGGKWTTYRRMAEDALEFAGKHGLLERRASVSAHMPLHGASDTGAVAEPSLDEYGSDRAEVDALTHGTASLGERIEATLPYTWAEVLFAVRKEQARTVEDVLSRRTRALLLDARATVKAAPRVAAMLAAELGRDEAWQRQQVEQFSTLARQHYLL